MGYKPCFMGSDSTKCPEDQACFQYFCCPKADAQVPLKSCKKTKECKAIDAAKKCYKQLATQGICVSSEDYETCESHEECQGRGEKCCGDYCCNKNYFDSLITISCKADDGICKEVQKDMKDMELPTTTTIATTTTTANSTTTTIATTTTTATSGVNHYHGPAVFSSVISALIFYYLVY